MLKWSVIFLLIAIVAGIFGFGVVVSGAMAIAKMIFFVFLLLCLVMLVGGLIKT